MPLIGIERAAKAKNELREVGSEPVSVAPKAE
jgi:hypothetical protein